MRHISDGAWLAVGSIMLLGMGCDGSGETPNPTSGGTSTSGGAPSGGQPTPVGGAATGGASSGGRASLGGVFNSGGIATSGGTPTGGAASGGMASSQVVVTIRNGIFWNDSQGNRIEAHGGGFIQVGSTWYWIGEDKSHNSGTFKAVNCYASSDLARWEFRRAVVTRQTASALDTADRIIERPKVIYNDATGRYVMWLHWEGKDYAEAAAGVFSSSTVDGNYTYHRSFRPNNNMSRDDTLFRDDDGKAYFVSAANSNADLAIYELTDDYLDISRQVATLWAGSYREAPALCKQNGTYYLITSGATGWDPNQAKYATASSMNGPWSSLQNLGNNIAYDSQSTYVLPVKGTQTTTYVFAADRWQDPDLVNSKYIWLPLKLSGTSLSLDYYNEWNLNLTTGAWSPYDGFIPHANWRVVYVDSEETSAENGRATNAFDDNANTLWHTQYTNAKPGQPHELQIDLGASYLVDTMQYLPRLDKDTPGIVAGYEFYVSQSTSSWGAAVATGTFGTDRSGKRVGFPAKAGRYVRFVSLSEINGSALTSMAELDVAGTRQ